LGECKRRRGQGAAREVMRGMWEKARKGKECDEGRGK